MIEWCFMPLSTVFQSYHCDSSHYLRISWVSPVPGWALKCLAQGHSHEKTQRIQYGLKLGPLDYESNTLPLSQTLNLFQNKPWFLCVCSTGVQLLVMSTFSFSHTVFSPFAEFSAISMKPKIIICKLFPISKICHLGKG